MKAEIFAAEIRKTGFVLENYIASELKRAGWTVISNKYYEDDFEGSVREIDLLAYKVAKLQDINVYTTLLISCKKSESNAWALLAREINLKDPNSDWWPLHFWTNDKPLLHELSQTGKAKQYHNGVQGLGVKEALSVPDVEVFAFQEMKKNGGAPQNDKNIFNAITSLMKAQAYELSSLSKRKKAASIYQFNLISVIDSDLIRIYFSDNDITAKPIDSEHYIARYIIKREESFSRVRFMKASYFTTAIEDYNKLHDANYHWFEKTSDSFYKKAIKDWERKNVLIDDFRSSLKWTFAYQIEHKFGVTLQIRDIDIDWREKKNSLAITLPVSMEILDFLNSDDKLKSTARKALKDVYHYSGTFFFSEDEIPF